MGDEVQASPRVLLVTGGGRGIGAAICRAAASEGYAVAINYRQQEEAAEATVEGIRAAGGVAMTIRADVARFDEIDAMFQEVDRRLGRVTHLVNNAGRSTDCAVEDVTAQMLEASFALNCFGPILCARAAILRMSSEHGGHGGAIVNISSRAAVSGGLPGRTVYAAAKGALESFTIGLAKEVGRGGIRVNCVRPGATLTDTHRDRGGAELLTRHTAGSALGRPAMPDEIAPAVLFLLSDAASFITGAVVEVSGGM